MLGQHPRQLLFLKGANELCRAGEGLCRLVAVWPLGPSGELPLTQLYLLRCGLPPVLEAASSGPLRLLFPPLSPPGYSSQLGTVTLRVSGSCQSRPTALVSGCGCSFLRPQEPKLFSQVPCAHGRIRTNSLSASVWAAGTSPLGQSRSGQAVTLALGRKVAQKPVPTSRPHGDRCSGQCARFVSAPACPWVRLGASVTFPDTPVSSGWPAIYTSLVGPLPWTCRRLVLWGGPLIPSRCPPTWHFSPCHRLRSPPCSRVMSVVSHMF